MNYTNPVYDHSFPDPFVLKYCGEYWAYCTGTRHDGRWFGVLRSRDLVEWEEIGGALEPLPGSSPCQWAPEVSYHNGRFYLYYSLGDEATMQIRVAVADHPAGPFVDSGRRLTHEPFAIDAHVFVDHDGARYLFYATDFLDHSHIGTGTVCDRLLDPLTLAGTPTPVTRARYDWQVYDPNRVEKGGVRWHTIEGSFVLEHKRRYYQMFSGGNWQNSSYGVSYAITDRVDTVDEWTQVADGVQVLPILRSVPGQVIGPGHNSVVRGPDNRQLFCVYHRWSANDRVMAIDPLDWAGERMFILGPSNSSRPINLPTLVDFFDRPAAFPWRFSGTGWSAGTGALVHAGGNSASASCPSSTQSYLVEVSARALAPDAPGGYGFAVGDALVFAIQPAQQRVLIRHDGREQAIALPADFAAEVFHLLRVEINSGVVDITVDEAALHWSGRLAGPGQPFALIADGIPVAFAGFALTEGWVDLFEDEGATPTDIGWLAPDAEAVAAWDNTGGALRTTASQRAALLLKGPLPAAYELSVNLAIVDQSGSYTIYPAARPGALGAGLALAHGPGGWALRCDDGGEEQHFALPADFDPQRFHQLRVRVAAGRMQLAYEQVSLGELIGAAGTHIGLAGAGVAFDGFRVVALSE